MGVKSGLGYWLTVPVTWARMTAHNSWGLLNVFDLIWLRPVQGGVVPDTHPFCTGIEPLTGRTVWLHNIVFRTPARDRAAVGRLLDDSDEQMILRIGRYMADFVRKAASSPDHPRGQASRMPPAIHLVHGAVHYNGGWLVFNDFAEAVRHFTDPAFLREFRRFVREERREPLTVFRQRDYDPKEYAEFVCVLRSVLPWFSNSNGNRTRVLWGAPSPYPVVATITGNWIRDVRGLLNNPASVLRPPVDAGRYFQGSYGAGSRSRAVWLERLLERFTYHRIRLRGARGNLFFVDRRKLDRGFRFEPGAMRGPMEKVRSWLASKAA